MHTTELFDETFDINQTASYHIFFYAEKNSFSIAILDIPRKKYIAFKHFPVKENLPVNLYCEEIEKIIDKEKPLLDKKYKQAKFIYTSPKYTFIPSSFFSEDAVKTFYEFNQYLEGLDELHYNKIAPVDAYSIFAIPNRLANDIKDMFANTTFYHQSTPFINYAYSAIKNNDTVWVNIYNGFIDVLAFKRDRLVFYNSFGFSNNKDIIYYIMHVYYLLNFSTLFASIHLSGDIEKNSELHKMISDYIKVVSFTKRHSENTYSYSLNKIDQHKFIPLLTFDD